MKRQYYSCLGLHGLQEQVVEMLSSLDRFDITLRNIVLVTKVCTVAIMAK